MLQEGSHGTLHKMRVLFATDDAYELIPGGHRVQVDRTAEALQRLGVDVAVGPPTPEALRNVDILHCVNAQLEQIRLARQLGRPVVMSTIYCSQSYVLGGIPTSPARRVARRFRQALGVIRHGPRDARARYVGPLVKKQLLFECADLLLPNSHLEAEAIRTELGVSTPAHVVPNGVDHHTFTPPSDRNAQRQGVLYVGRLEPHKNQLGLINAFRETGEMLTIVGGEHPHHPAYAEACHKAGGPQVTFLGERDQAGLVDLYQSCKVHAMPSWFETTGLSSLEAALCGAAVVSTGRGYATEYFGACAQYCDPRSAESIRRAVRSALAAGPHPDLRDHVLNHFTWDHTARATLDAYKRVLGFQQRQTVPDIQAAR